MLLAGDLGGTKTLLGLYRPGPTRPALVRSAAFTTLDYPSLDAMIQEFLGVEGPIDAGLDAAFGVAGPIRGRVATLTNVPWAVDAAEIAPRFSFRSLALLNDLQAMAYSVPALAADERVPLQEGRAAAGGNIALIAAGTGLGEALLHNVDGRYVPSPSEGGHADYAPRTEVEIGLLRDLVHTFGRAQYEHVLSGPGLVNIHRHLHDRPCEACDPATDPAAAPALITTAALEGRCPRCVQTLDLFVEIYGAETGNHALRCMATAGVYVGGGIAPKILPALQAGRFMTAFRAKQPLDDLLAAMPVFVILNQRAGLLGAAVCANQAFAARR